MVIKGYPPNYATIKVILNPPETTCFTYGNEIYSPTEELSPDILIHESVHERQQGDNPEAWWDKYLIDENFRKEQEIEAYSTQYKWIRERFNAKIAKKFLDNYAKHLSTLYRLNITKSQALTLIRKYENSNSNSK